MLHVWRHLSTPRIHTEDSTAVVLVILVGYTAEWCDNCALILQCNDDMCKCIMGILVCYLSI